MNLHAPLPPQNPGAGIHTPGTLEPVAGVVSRQDATRGRLQGATCTTGYPFPFPFPTSPADGDGYPTIAVGCLPIVPRPAEIPPRTLRDSGGQTAGERVGVHVTRLWPREIRFGVQPTGREERMAQHRRLADQTIEEAEEVQDAAAKVVLLVRRASSDGVVTLEEARDIAEAALRTYHEAAEVVTIAERTSVAELVAASVLTGQMNTHVTKRARECGVVLPLFGDAPEAA